jgi:glycosyl transferase family 2
MSAPPTFSIVIPTRDRPDFVRWALEALQVQTWSDFEVVVSDNHTGKPCRDEVDALHDDRIVYVAPEAPVSMADNWELAVSHATGSYVTVVTDKTIFLPSALEQVARVISEHAAPEIVTWWSDGFDPWSQATGVATGLYRPYFDAVNPRAYDPRAVLRERLRFAERRGTEGVRYYAGKIAFGVYHRGLIERITAAIGRLFFPIAPDYTSMVPASWLADRAFDVGRPLQIQINSLASNGRWQALDPAHARRFLMETDPTGAILDALPVPGLYAAVHNVVAYDYVASIARLHAGEQLELDMANVLRRAREDLALMRWTDRSERRAQYALLAEFEQRYGVEPARSPIVGQRLRGMTLGRRSRSTRAGRVARRVLGHPLGHRYRTVVDAARAADAFYAGLTTTARSSGEVLPG